MKKAHKSTTIKTVDPGSHPRLALKNLINLSEILLSANIYPARVNIGMAANVGETTILYALSLIVEIKS